MLKLSIEQIAQAVYWEICVSVFTSEKIEVKASWGTDDICFAYAIYYLIIHHVFCRTEGMLIWEQVLILKSGSLPAYSSNPITSNLFTWYKTCNCLLVFHILGHWWKYTNKTHPAAQSVAVVLTFFMQSALFPPSDHQGGSLGCT